MRESNLRCVVKAANLQDQAPFRRAFSYTNEVWIGRTVVLRISPVGNAWTSQHEQELLSWLPEGVPHAAVLGSGTCNGRFWLALRRMPGRVLGRLWPGLSNVQRREFIQQVGTAMRELHAVPFPMAWQRPDLTTAALARLRTPTAIAEPYQQPPERIEALASAAQSLEFVDAGLVKASHELVSQRLSLFENDRRAIVHTDLHWENLMSDGAVITAFLDFEQAQPAVPDLELDVLLRFCAWPHLPVESDYEDQLKPEDFADVPDWLAGAYPELFSGRNLRERLEVYAVMHDLRQGIQFPEVPGSERPPWAPWNRLRATLDGTGYLARWL
jgi:hygromycin-B 7''-O-kinase